MRKYLFFSLCLVWGISVFQVNAQNALVLKEKADQCRQYARKIYQGPEDFLRYAYSDSLKNALHALLESPEAYAIAFDSVPGFSRVCSEDERICVYTWMIHRSDGRFEYAGCVLNRATASGKNQLTWLEDVSDTLGLPETRILTGGRWYGCLVYQIIQAEKKNPSFYTLLGFDGNDGISRKKIIDILSIKNNGTLVFGGPAFVKYGLKTRRVIFEYSAKSGFRLSYDYQTVYYRKPGKKNKVREETLDLIVFDRLAPLNPGLEGQFQYYVPETNVVDGFRWTRGKWLYIKEIDARNPESGKKAVRKPPQMGLTPNSK